MVTHCNNAADVKNYDQDNNSSLVSLIIEWLYPVINMNMWWSIIMNMQSQGYVEWVIFEISTVSWTQHQGLFLVYINDD